MQISCSDTPHVRTVGGIAVAGALGALAGDTAHSAVPQIVAYGGSGGGRPG